MSVNYFLPRDPADPYKFRYMHQLSTAEIDHALYNMEQRLRGMGYSNKVNLLTALVQIQRELLRRLTEKEKDDAAGVTATLG